MNGSVVIAKMAGTGVDREHQVDELHQHQGQEHGVTETFEPAREWLVPCTQKALPRKPSVTHVPLQELSAAVCSRCRAGGRQ